MKPFILSMFILMLAACANAAPTGSPATLAPNSTAPAPPSVAAVQQTPAAPPDVPTLSPAPTATPAVASPSPSAPAAPAAGTGQVYSNEPLGFSFRYPDGWQILDRAPDAPPGVTIRAPSVGEGPEPIIFAVTVDIQDTSGTDVKKVVDDQLSQIPADLRKGIQQREIVVGGRPAEQVIGLPSSAGAVETFILDRGRVFLVLLQPYDPTNTVLIPYLNQAILAYNQVLETWKFIP